MPATINCISVRFSSLSCSLFFLLLSLPGERGLISAAVVNFYSLSHIVWPVSSVFFSTTGLCLTNDMDNAMKHEVMTCPLSSLRFWAGSSI
jgi:hypothetical protein